MDTPVDPPSVLRGQLTPRSAVLPAVVNTAPLVLFFTFNETTLLNLLEFTVTLPPNSCSLEMVVETEEERLPTTTVSTNSEPEWIGITMRIPLAPTALTSSCYVHFNRIGVGEYPAPITIDGISCFGHTAEWVRARSAVNQAPLGVLSVLQFQQVESTAIAYDTVDVQLTRVSQKLEEFNDAKKRPNVLKDAADRARSINHLSFVSGCSKGKNENYWSRVHSSPDRQLDALAYLLEHPSGHVCLTVAVRDDHPDTLYIATNQLHRPSDAKDQEPNGRYALPESMTDKMILCKQNFDRFLDADKILAYIDVWCRSEDWIKDVDRKYALGIIDIIKDKIRDIVTSTRSLLDKPEFKETWSSGLPTNESDAPSTDESVQLLVTVLNKYRLLSSYKKNLHPGSRKDLVLQTALKGVMLVESLEMHLSSEINRIISAENDTANTDDNKTTEPLYYDIAKIPAKLRNLALAVQRWSFWHTLVGSCHKEMLEAFEKFEAGETIKQDWSKIAKDIDVVLLGLYPHEREVWSEISQSFKSAGSYGLLLLQTVRLIMVEVSAREVESEYAKVTQEHFKSREKVFCTVMDNIGSYSAIKLVQCGLPDDGTLRSIPNRTLEEQVFYRSTLFSPLQSELLKLRRNPSKQLPATWKGFLSGCTDSGEWDKEKKDRFKLIYDTYTHLKTNPSKANRRDLHGEILMWLFMEEHFPLELSRITFGISKPACGSCSFFLLACIDKTSVPIFYECCNQAFDHTLFVVEEKKLMTPACQHHQENVAFPLEDFPPDRSVETTCIPTQQ